MKPNPILVAWVEALMAHQHPICGGRLINVNNAYCAQGLLCDVHPEFQVNRPKGNGPNFHPWFEADYIGHQGQRITHNGGKGTLDADVFYDLFEVPFTSKDPNGDPGFSKEHRNIIIEIMSIFFHNDRAVNYVALAAAMRDQSKTDWEPLPDFNNYIEYKDLPATYSLTCPREAYRYRNAEAPLPHDLQKLLYLTHERAADLIVTSWMKIHNITERPAEFPDTTVRASGGARDTEAVSQ